MHQAVELILARMKSHPEDFVYERGLGSNNSKWYNLVMGYSSNFTEEENEAINNEFKNVSEWQRTTRLDECTEEIYKLMAGDGEGTDLSEQALSEAIARMNTQARLNNNHMLLSPEMKSLLSAETERR